MAQPVKVGSEFSVNVAAAGTQNAPWVTYLKNGNYVVVWVDGSGSSNDVRMQIFTASGATLGGEVTVHNDVTGNQGTPRIAALDNGNFIVNWTDTGTMLGNTATGIAAQLFQSDGTRIGTNFLLSGGASAAASSGAVASLPDGGVIGVYATQTTIFLKIFDAQGQPTTGQNRVISGFGTPPAGTLTLPSISMLGNGNYVVAWQASTGDPSGSGIRAAIVSPAGFVLTSFNDIRVNAVTPLNQTAPSVAALGGGSFVVVWTDASTFDEVSTGIKARIFDANGVAITGDFRVNTTTAGVQTSGTVRALADGGFIVTWIDSSAAIGDPNLVTVGQRFDASGARIGGEVIIGSIGTATQATPIPAINGSDVIVVYADSLGDGADPGIRAQRLSVDLAVNDAATTTEAASMAIAILANDGGLTAVSTLNGAAATVGAVVTLASGATVVLNADNTVTYDPAAKFNYLLPTTTATGGQTTATDSFTYGAAGGAGTATVTVTITGVAGAGDQIRGGTGNDTLLGTPAADYIDISQGGTDSVNAGDGDDLIFAGGNFAAATVIDGGAGTDQFGLRGNFTRTLDTVANTEALVLLSSQSIRFGPDGGVLFSYDLTTTDATVASGVGYVVQANELIAGENLRFNGAAETDGSFRIYAGKGIDTLTGGSGNDGFFFGEGGRFTAADTIDGGIGNDQIGLRGNYNVTFTATTVTNVETIVLLSAFDAGPATEAAAYAYALTLDDATIANGQMLTVNAGQLRSTESAAISAANESNGTVTLIGGAGIDFLTGGAGADVFYGGGGADTLEGGAGADIFRYGAASDSATGARDTIVDFRVGDIIDLARIDAVPGGADNAFRFIEDRAFSGVAGELRVTLVSPGNYLVEGDIDGVGGADFAISVRSDHAITAPDFLL